MKRGLGGYGLKFWDCMELVYSSTYKFLVWLHLILDVPETTPDSDLPETTAVFDSRVISTTDSPIDSTPVINSEPVLVEQNLNDQLTPNEGWIEHICGLDCNFEPNQPTSFDLLATVVVCVLQSHRDISSDSRNTFTVNSMCRRRHAR